MALFEDEEVKIPSKPNEPVKVPDEVPVQPEVKNIINAGSDSKPTTTVTQRHQFTKAEDMGITTVVSKERSLSTVIQFIEGYPWKVDYYNNIAAQNDQVERLSLNLDKTVQKYKKIRDMTLYLDSPINGEIRGTEGLEVEGIINSGIIPFQNDMIVVTMVSSRKGLFTVTKVDNQTYLQHTVYRVTLKFLSYADADNKLYNNLEYKVIQTYVEDNNYITDYGSPILLEEDYKAKVDLKATRRNLISLYLDLFYDPGYKFLNLLAKPYPGKEVMEPDPLCILSSGNNRLKILDEYIYNFFRSMVSIEDDYRLELLSLPGYLDYTMQLPTILDAIKNLDKNYLYNSNRHVGIRQPNQHLRGEQQPVVLLDIGLVVDSIKEPSSFVGHCWDSLSFRPNIKTDHEAEVYPLKMDKPSSSYIFSDAFYNNDLDKCTKFELIVKRYLEGGTVLAKELMFYINTIRNWSRYEQFYVTPILIAMINYMTKKSYSAR